MGNLNRTESEGFDAKKTALVVIDLQNGIANSPKTGPYTGAEVIKNASTLVQAFTDKGAFVVLVRVSWLDGQDVLRPQTDLPPSAAQFPVGWDSLVPELAEFNNAHVITKRQWGAFFGTDLDLQLRRRGIERIVLCGISTSIGVDTTAREAFQLGYHQVFVEDSMTAMAKEEHDYVCKTIFPRLGKIRTTAEVVESLQ